MPKSKKYQKRRGKMRIHYFGITKAQYGYSAEVEIIVSTRRQCTKEHHSFRVWSKTLIGVLWDIYFHSKKEAKRLQQIDGEWELE